MANYLIILMSILLPLAAAKEFDVPDFRNAGDKILEWEAPEEMKKNYPYYLSGHDDDGVPIWVAELGKWDTRTISDKSPESRRDYKMYCIQMFKRCVNNNFGKNDLDEEHKFNLLFDMEGFTVRQTGSAESLKMMLWIARQAEQAFTENLNSAFFVNANFVFTRLFDIMRPLLGRSLYRVEVFGTNKAIWIPKILSRLPKNQIPEWYGGVENHKPLQVFG